MPFVRLDRLLVEPGRVDVSARAAEAGKLVISHDRERLAGKLPGGDARHRAFEREEVGGERGPSGGERIVRQGRHPELHEPRLDQAVVLRLVPGLPREGELHGDLGGRRDPRPRALGGLDLVSQREHQEARDGERRVGLTCGRRRGDAAEGRTVLRVELGNEGFGCAGHRGRL